jgi:hypothetical protein
LTRVGGGAVGVGGGSAVAVGEAARGVGLRVVVCGLVHAGRKATIRIARARKWYHFIFCILPKDSTVVGGQGSIFIVPYYALSVKAWVYLMGDL